MDDPDPPLPAGGFAAWLAGMRGAMAGEADADVPCGTCTACCTSSQFVHIEPDETEALAHIPRRLLFPAPLLAKGHVLLGYDEHGRCPMLVDDRCSIYAHRPRTCRTYDCRVFTAAGVVPEPDKPAIARRVRQWQFDVVTDADRAARDAVLAAAEAVASGDGAGGSATNRAVLAVRAATR